MAHRAGALSRGPPGPAHAPVGDEGLGLRLAWTTLGLGRRDGRGDSPYWLVPFQNYKTMCPYLVGSYERGGDELARYIGGGDRAVILHIPPTEGGLHHTNQAFRRAVTLVTQ